MKKALILCGTLSITLFTNAQEATPAYTPAVAQEVKPVRLGFAIAPALTWLTSDTRGIDTKGQRIGFAYGVLVDFTIAKSNNYALATGFFINHSGGKLQYIDAQSKSPSDPSVTRQTANTDIAAKIQYIEVPFTLKLKTNEIGYMSYFGQFGVLGGVKLGAKQNGEFTFNEFGTNPQLIDNEGYNDDTRLFNAGLLIGIGTEYNISGNTNLVFGIQYYRGFTNVLDRKVLVTNENNDIVLDENLNPRVGSKASAFLNHVALQIGVIF